MMQTPHFLRACPVCGRPLLIRVEHTDQEVSCRHCGGAFVASDPSPPYGPGTKPRSRLIHQAEELLQLVSERLRPGRRMAVH